jgi:amino acid adenylation domain-containing protein
MVNPLTKWPAMAAGAGAAVFETFPGLERKAGATCAASLDIDADAVARLAAHCGTCRLHPRSVWLAIHLYALCRIYAGTRALSYLLDAAEPDGAALLAFDWRAGLRWSELAAELDAAVSLAGAAEPPAEQGGGARVLWAWNCPDAKARARQLAGAEPLLLIELLTLPADGAMRLTLTVDGASATAAQLEYYAATYRHLLDHFLQHHAAPIAKDDFHTPMGRQRLLSGLRGPVRALDLPSLPEVLAANARQHGDKAAFVCGDQVVTFGEFHERVRRTAAGLAARGIGRNDKVAVFSMRDIEWAVLQMACMAIGAVYVPVDPGFPRERIAHMLGQAEVALVAVTTSVGRSVIDGLAAELGIALAEYRQLLAPVGCDWDAVCAAFSRGDVAYIQFTSGTTGVPKGAMVEHLGMLNHLAAKIGVLQLTGADRIAQTATQCFDVSIWQLMVGLYTGSTTVIYPEEVIWNMVDYLAYTHSQAVTVLEVVPSYLALLFGVMAQCGGQALAGLRYLMVTGERVTLGQVRQWFDACPLVPVINAYGPTEASDDITHFVIEAGFQGSRVPVGFPICNTTIHILDQELALLPFGSIGEICASGICVGRGYINRPAETAKAFVNDPFEPGLVRMYRTGDFGRWLGDGSIEYFGRRDEQVKVMGVRIELTEIEQQLSLLAALKEVAVVHRDGRLVCFYTSRDAAAVPAQDIRKLLKNSLPAHSIPARFVHLEKMPLNKNDKIDKARLP